MSAVFFGSIPGPVAVAAVVVVSAGVVVFLARHSIRALLAQRRQRALRQRERQQFWGYE